jgi:hypothetical protein
MKGQGHAVMAEDMHHQSSDGGSDDDEERFLEALVHGFPLG